MTDSSLPRTSASEVEVFANECERKWGFKYILRMKTPMGPAAALGTEVDEGQLQPYLRDGRPFDFTKPSGYIAAAGLAYLPAVGTPGMELQKHFFLPSPGEGFSYHGFIDLWLPKAGMPDLPPPPEGFITPVVSDFKTTKDINAWSKTTETLKTNIQAMLYATWAMYETRAKEVDLAWIYLQTQGAKKTKRVHIRVDQNHVLGEFLKIDAIATRMFETRTSCDDPLQLKPNPSMCSAYGGCPFQHLCNLSPSQMLDGMSPTPSTKRKLPMAANSTGDLMARLAAKKANGTATMGMSDRDVPAPPADVIPPAFAMPSVAFPPMPTVMVGINPPEQHLPPAPPLGTIVIPAASVTAPSTAPVAEKPKRGRPKKAPSPLAEQVLEAISEPVDVPATRAPTQATPHINTVVSDLITAAAALGEAIRAAATALAVK